MEELRNFRKANNLTQEQLGEYLGIKKSFISRVENGQVALPADKFTKLLENDRGWDTSALRAKVESVDPSVSPKIHMMDLFSGPVRNISAKNKNWDAKHIEMLERRVEELTRQNAEYWELIKKLMDK